MSAGVVVQLLGRAFINDMKLLVAFLTILEHILNTLLFTLGGAEWGSIIATGEKSGVWAAREWGYLILLYVLLTVIRVFQFLGTYPITVRIGLKTTWPETAFQIFGGLRGALGITLALTLDRRVADAAGGQNETIHEIHTKQAFVCIGKKKNFDPGVTQLLELKLSRPVFRRGCIHDARFEFSVGWSISANARTC